MNAPKVSVIIPAHNSEGSLRQAVDSALSQNPISVEVIVVDDGSTDGTAAVAAAYGDRIRFVAQENQGQGAARNVGLELAQGEFIAFLDADDYWRTGFLEACVDFLQRHAEAIAVSTATVIKLADGKERISPACIREPNGIREPIIIEDFFQFWADQDHVRTGSNIIRKSVVDKAGGQRADLRVSQDLEYWGNIATFGKWGFIPKPLWVGNSRAVGASSGWLKKYAKRRRLCPTVEAWESRIVPRLTTEQIRPFEVVKGRVAAGYAHNKILGGDTKGAHHIVSKYGANMPRNKLTRLIRLGHSLGPIGWKVACGIVTARERLKAVRLGRMKVTRRIN